MRVVDVGDFAQWRAEARQALREGFAPAQILWTDDGQESLFCEEPQPRGPGVERPRVPPAFLRLAEAAACFRHPSRWGLLYRMLHRLQHGEPHLLELASDPDVTRLQTMASEVDRDVHKMHAFVRFRKLCTEQGELYVAWHEPLHLVVERATPFFARRFEAMRWSILTPDRSAFWDGQQLTYGPGATRAHAPDSDLTEELWKTYYRHIFNPARLKLRAMASEMPKRHWSTMPETALIPEMIAESEERVQTMMASGALELPAPAAAKLVQAGGTLEDLRAAAGRCRACDLCQGDSAMVFGEGPAQARLMLVGEQPGDLEERQGRPFVGPAGQLLREVLEQVGVAPETVYLSNTVKHFRWVSPPAGGKRRIHQRATARQISTCVGWVQAEIALVRPKVLICLGATAGQALLGPRFRLADRGRWLDSNLAPRVMATVHPSFVLRLQDPLAQQRQRELFRQDLALAAAAVNEGLQPRQRAGED